jgi:hypothetical protein
VDPVTLGLCSQLELDLAVSRVNAKLERAQKRAAKKGAALKSIAETTRRSVGDAGGGAGRRRRRPGSRRVQTVE